ncbi:hypothetical protein BD560DRAFT_361963 [Blakeslea trispora]|nr:hypothetical protein BD560DRAFT_361963 [Blakeslea trispora]
MLKFLLALSLFCSLVCADMAPSYPEPGTIWTTGQEYKIVWFDDRQQPHMKKTWTNFAIDFMTGDNANQKFLQNVAKGLNAMNTTSFKWTAPKVEPYAPIYFFRFTNDKGDVNWTTRFGIADPEGQMEKPAYSKQPNGDEIPWGIGKIVQTATYSMNPAMASAAEKNAALVIAVSHEEANSSPERLPSVLIISCFAIYLTILLI